MLSFSDRHRNAWRWWQQIGVAGFRAQGTIFFFRVDACRPQLEPGLCLPCGLISLFLFFLPLSSHSSNKRESVSFCPLLPSRYLFSFLFFRPRLSSSHTRSTGSPLFFDRWVRTVCCTEKPSTRHPWIPRIEYRWFCVIIAFFFLFCLGARSSLAFGFKRKFPRT